MSFAALLVLTTGCGGGGGNQDATAFNVVGSWHVDTLSDQSGSVACAGTLPSKRFCDGDLIWTFYEAGAGKLASSSSSSTFTWRMNGGNIIVKTAPDAPDTVYEILSPSGNEFKLRGGDYPDNYIEESLHRLSG